MLDKTDEKILCFFIFAFSLILIFNGGVGLLGIQLPTIIDGLVTLIVDVLFFLFKISFIYIGVKAAYRQLMK